MTLFCLSLNYCLFWTLRQKEYESEIMLNAMLCCMSQAVIFS